jgi:hypothetical protein
MTAAAPDSTWPKPTRPPAADASPAGIRAALTPEDAAEFDQQWRAVMATATEALDLTEVMATLDSWRCVARLTSSLGPDDYRRLLDHAEHTLRTGQHPTGAVPWRQVAAELGL